MQLSVWEASVSAPGPGGLGAWQVPMAETLAGMTSSTNAQEDINSCMFVPGQKA